MINGSPQKDVTGGNLIKDRGTKQQKEKEREGEKGRRERRKERDQEQYK